MHINDESSLFTGDWIIIIFIRGVIVNLNFEMSGFGLSIIEWCFYFGTESKVSF